MDEKILEEMGFSPNEAKVYLTLLRTGSVPISDIAKNSNVHRSNVYDILERLMAKGLVTSIVKENKKFYDATNPNNLFDILREREAKLSKAIPEMIAVFENRKEKQEVYHFKGREGIKMVLRDINRYKTYDAFGISSNLAKVVPYYFPQWIRERLRKNLFARMIKTKGDLLVTPEIVGLSGYRKLFHVKEVGREHFTAAATFIYENKVAIILENIHSPLAIVIENDEIADGYRKQFNVMWQIADEEDINIYREAYKVKE